MEPADIRYHLEKARAPRAHGRPGPVWLDLPLDVQGAMIDETTLRSYDPAEDAVSRGWPPPASSPRPSPDDRSVERRRASGPC
jgi:acetolactate synthase-1/2/3 large subunit